ncbi:MAG: Maf family protein [Methylobacterium sp.]|nr:Maf family protein [Methylobacterium sp.]MCA3652323.1 Maf family protein [Methylobacterium sp.]MCA4922149.1 Maf family protein [Methylobacterium sp.]
MRASPFWLGAEPLVLASGSSARRLLLESCGIPLEIVRPRVDEKAIAATLLESRADPAEIAIALAHAKAEAVARLHPDRLVLAADQTLDLEGSLFMKPADRGAAQAQIARLRGKAHHLHSASALRRGETVLWAGLSSATLLMRPFDDAFLESYLDAMGPRVTETVGGYEMEGLGPHLFSEIVGDHATILGLPLLGVLYALREAGVLAGAEEIEA